MQFSRLGRVAAAAVLCAAVALASCDVRDPLEGVRVRINFSATPTVAGVELVDAATGLSLGATPVTVRFSGPGAARTVDLAGQPISQVVVRDGLLGFGLTGAAPTDQAPVRLTVHVVGPGLVETSRDIVLSGPTSTPALLGMVRTAEPPRGASAGGNAAPTGSGGALSRDVPVSTGQEAIRNTQTQVTIPTGTLVRDQAGTPLSGALQATVVHFNGNEPPARGLLPGGTGGSRVQNPPAGIGQYAAFTVAGFAAVSVTDAQGRTGRTLSQPMQVRIGVPGNTVNPTTNQPVRAGEVVPYWSLDPTHGEWRYEGAVPLAPPDGLGNLAGVFPASNLGFYSLGWPHGVCTSTRVTTGGNHDGRRLHYTLHRAGQAIASWAATEPASTQYDQPQGIARIEVEDPVTGAVVGQAMLNDACANPSVTVALPPAVTMNLQVRATCQDRIELRPSAQISVREQTAAGWRTVTSGTVKNGAGVIAGLKPNTQYTLVGGGFYNGTYYEGSRVVTTGPAGSQDLTINFQVGSDVCN